MHGRIFLLKKKKKNINTLGNSVFAGALELGKKIKNKNYKL